MPTADVPGVLNDKIALLRQELKAWEKAFAATHGGRKAARDDIKQDAGIAAKYREYDRLRRPPSDNKPNSQPTIPPANPARDVHESPVRPVQQPAATPQKTGTRLPAPSIPVQVPETRILEGEGEATVEPTPAAIRIQLGPTPQRDGQILSLFDSTPAETPSRNRSALVNGQRNTTTTTPSKARPDHTTIAQSPASNIDRASRTPASSGKRFLLDTFATPLKRKREDDDEGTGTPSSSMKAFATPAFLRRSNTISIMETLAEEAEHDDDFYGTAGARAPPFKGKRGFVRSLSSIIQGMRNQEDDRLDEEMELMREMEGETEGFANVESLSTSKKRAANLAVPVDDSQVAMPLGPDRGSDSSEEEDEQLDDQNGQPRKPWKKKGLKRQTKRVIMRPVLHKPKKADAQQPDGADKEDCEDDDDVVAETQLHPATLVDHDDDESDYGTSAASDTRTKNKQAVQPAQETSQSANDGKGTIRKAVRMISAGAHANFRKLNIKNQNTKAKGRGRFGRR